MAPRVQANRVKKEEQRVTSHKELLLVNDEVKFSYKYLNLEHEKFCIDCLDTEYFLKLIARLKDVSTITISELRRPLNNKALRSHAIKWCDVTESCFGIPNEEEIASDPWQFSLSKTEHGRIHGFLIGNVFYIVWFDPEHNLYS